MDAWNIFRWSKLGTRIATAWQQSKLGMDEEWLDRYLSIRMANGEMETKDNATVSTEKKREPWPGPVDLTKRTRKT